MAKASIDLRSLARSHTGTAVRTLASIMNQSDAPPAARVGAASALLDRGWGKPTQPHDGDGEGGAIKLHHTIEQHIVDPKDRGS